MSTDKNYIEKLRDADNYKLSDLDLTFLYGTPPVTSNLTFHQDMLGNILFAKSEMTIFGRGGVKPLHLESLIKLEDIPQYLQAL